MTDPAYLQAALERSEQRIRDLAVMFGVPDGGRYLNDWKSRAEKYAALLARAEAAEAMLIPRKPTKAMRLAGLQELPIGPSSPAHAGACWTAMWDAAHPQPQAPVMGGETQS